MISAAARKSILSGELPHIFREYALLADGERGVIVGPRGGYAWMCFPRWDSPAIFSTLIGGSGIYAVTPRDRAVWGGYYEAGSLIWHSRWVTGDATIECREALALPSRPDRAVILRRVIARTGTARVDVVLNPRAEFGQTGLKKLRRADDGSWTGELERARMSWSGGHDATPQADGHGGKALTLSLELAEGSHHDFVLVLASGDDPGQSPDPDRAWQGTEAEWADRVPEFEGTVAPRDARHAYTVLSGLTSGGGGMVAAATMSLPERARQGRNYDYRYVWIRDQCYVGQAVAKAAPHPLMDDAVRFVSDRLLADGPQLKPAYTTEGGPVPDQRQLGLPGYPGGSDIVGNWVALADALVAHTSEHALHASGRWQRSPTDERVDAALLLPVVRGAIPASDPRTLATLQAIERELTEDGYCYRYRPDERPLGASEGAFLLCGFWMALAHAQQGNHVAAARWFERRRAACGPPSLYAEEFDVSQHQLRGNLPQAFVHALLLECAVEQFTPAA